MPSEWFGVVLVESWKSHNHALWTQDGDCLDLHEFDLNDVTRLQRNRASGWRFDATVLLTLGPSAVVAPQVEVRLMDGLYANVGAQFYQGPPPVIKAGLAPTNLTFGGLYAGYDNVYVGFRWMP